MPQISEQFQKKFSEIEDAHIEMKKRLEGFAEKGTFLDDRIESELDLFLGWWEQSGSELADLVMDLSPEEQNHYRDYTLGSRLAEILQESPFFWRIINRPEGYPGDAEMMNIIYRNTFEGESPFGRFATRGAVRAQICQAVRNRKTFLYDQIMTTGGGRILSLAAGPAREMYEVLQAKPDGMAFDFLALDHDINTIRRARAAGGSSGVKYALANAFRLIKNDYTVAFPLSDQLDNCDPKTDFSGPPEMITGKYLIQTLDFNAFDLVYSAGLYDYIETFDGQPEKGAVALTANLFRLVKPGGALVIGNMGDSINGSDLFSMEYLQNWLIIRRNEDEMLAFADGIPEAEIAGISVLKEPESVNYFLKIQKKQA